MTDAPCSGGQREILESINILNLKNRVGNIRDITDYSYTLKDIYAKSK